MAGRGRPKEEFTMAVEKHAGRCKLLSVNDALFKVWEEGERQRKKAVWGDVRAAREAVTTAAGRRTQVRATLAQLTGPAAKRSAVALVGYLRRTVPALAKVPERTLRRDIAELRKLAT